MATGFQEGEFPEGASPPPRARQKCMELWFALKVTQSHFYHILLIVCHKILPQFKSHGQRPSHVMGTCRMRDMVGTWLWKICLPFYLGLFFPSPLLSPSCSIVASLPVVSPLCGLLCVEGSSGWVTFRSSQQLDYCRPFKPCHELLALPGFGLGSFSHCLGTAAIWVFPFLRSVRHLFASLCFLPHRH